MTKPLMVWAIDGIGEQLIAAAPSRAAFARLLHDYQAMWSDHAVAQGSRRYDGLASAALALALPGVLLRRPDHADPLIWQRTDTQARVRLDPAGEVVPA